MSRQQAKKSSKNGGSHAPHPVLDTVESLQQAQEKVIAFGHRNIEEAVHSAQSCSRAVMDSLGLCSREMNIMAKSGSVAGGALRAMSNMLMQGITLSFNHWMAFLRDAAKCGSLDDLQALQEDYAHRLASDYFYEADKFCTVLFDSYEEALEPLGEQARLITRQRREPAAGRAV